MGRTKQLHGNRVLTDFDIAIVRAICNAGDTSEKDLALRFGVSVNTISLIRLGKRYTHIYPEDFGVDALSMKRIG